MKKLTEKLKSITVNKFNIDKQTLTKFAEVFCKNAESEEDLIEYLEYYYSLNEVDIINFHRILFENNYFENTDKNAIKYYKDNSQKIDDLINTLNRESVKQTSLPFHLSIALQKYKPNAKVIEETNLEVSKNIFSNVSQISINHGCPENNFPFYIGASYTWKFWQYQIGWHLRGVKRKEDTGCNIEHSEFHNGMRGWATMNPLIVAMIYTNGWGGYLAANNSMLFYKSWACAIYLLNPAILIAHLYVRRW